jgi:chromosome segregation ATPase
MLGLWTVSAIPSTVDLSPAAERRLATDEAERTWQNAPILARLDALERTIMVEFEGLQAAVAGISGEGGEIAQAKDAVLAAIGGLQSINVNLQEQLALAQSTLAQAQADLAAGRQVAADSTSTLETVKSEFDTAEQQLNDAAAALQPAPEPAPTG